MKIKELMDAWLASHERVIDSLPRPSGGAVSAEGSHALVTWDEELSRMQMAFARALERRNELAPISALPAELLARIFSHLAESWPVNSDSPHKATTTGGWTRVARVCRRWRSVAIDCASLWATIAVNGREPIDLFLLRAREHVLSVVGQVRAKDVYDLSRLEHLLGQLGRLRSLDMHVLYNSFGTDLPDAESIIFNCLTNHPQIEHLSLHRAQPSYLTGAFASTTANFHAPRLSNTFVSTASLLTTVRLVGYSYPWGVRSGSLRSLTVELSEPVYPRGFSMHEMLDTLRGTPALERLVLTHGFPDAPQDVQRFVEDQAAVPLPRLREMQLASHNETAWILLALVEAQASAKINLRFHHSMSASPPTHVITMALSRFLQRPLCPEYKGLTLWQTHSTSIGVRLKVDSVADYQSETPADLELHMESDDLDELLLAILRVVSLEHIEALAIRGKCYTWPPEDVRSLFANARRLRTVSLRGTQVAQVLFPSLIPEEAANEDPSDAPHDELLLANIQELHIDRVDLKRPAPDTHTGSDGSARRLGEWLTSFLSIRRSGNPLSLLTVERSALFRGWVEAWKPLVADVVWDEDEVGDHAMEERVLSGEQFGVEHFGGAWAVPASWDDEDELNFLGGHDAHSAASLEWEQEGLSELEEDEDEDEDDIDQDDPW
ncbi:unnamed protein product [Peniophora sp. CBMAI 1063]|nr:unnamed protein product [Peniophora sp. CBMAI 1063]